MIMSIGVVIASLFIYYDSNLKIADPICTYIFSIIVCFTVYPIVKDCMRVLLEGVPDSFNTRKFLEDIRKIEGVMAIHDFHIWSISVGKLALSMHIQSSTNSMKVLKEVTEFCKNKYNIDHITIQMEDQSEDNEHAFSCEQTTHKEIQMD